MILSWIIPINTNTCENKFSSCLTHCLGPTANCSSLICINFISYVTYLYSYNDRTVSSADIHGICSHSRQECQEIRMAPYLWGFFGPTIWLTSHKCTRTTLPQPKLREHSHAISRRIDQVLRWSSMSFDFTLIDHISCLIWCQLNTVHPPTNHILDFHINIKTIDRAPRSTNSAS